MPPSDTKMFSTTVRAESGELYKSFTIADNASSAAKYFAAARVLDVIDVQSVRRMEVHRKGRVYLYYNIFGKDTFGRLIVNVMQEEGNAVRGRVWVGIPAPEDSPTDNADVEETNSE